MQIHEYGIVTFYSAGRTTSFNVMRRGSGRIDKYQIDEHFRIDSNSSVSGIGEYVCVVAEDLDFIYWFKILDTMYGVHMLERMN